MSEFGFTFLVLLLVIVSAGVIFYLVYSLNRIRKKIKLIEEERENERDHFEMMVRERTHNLELIRDSVSEYAVQKSELAQALEEKNKEISRQKDDQFKQSEKLKIAYDEIKKLESYRQQMTRMIIHDLKNPLKHNYQYCRNK